MVTNLNIKAIHARQKARKKLVQALYQWRITESSPSEIEQQFSENQSDFNKTDREFFLRTLEEITLKYKELSYKVKPYIDIDFEKVDIIEQGVLVLGLYEFEYHLDVPYKVIINESVNLAKCFGATDSHKFINGVMDKLAKKYRSLEYRN